MDDESKPKAPRISRAAQRASKNGNPEPQTSLLEASGSIKGSSNLNAASAAQKKPRSLAAILIPGCCLFVFLAVVAFPGATLGLIWNLLTMGRYTNYDPEPVVESTNAPIAQSFLGEVTAYAPTISRFDNWTMAVWAYGMNCPDTGDASGDSCQMAETTRVAQPDDEGACLEAFKIAENFGLQSDVIIGETQGKPYGSASLERCKRMMSSYPRSVGWGWFGPEYYLKGTSSGGVKWVMLLDRAQQTTPEESRVNKKGKLNVEQYGYTLTVGTDFGNAYSGVNEGPNYSDNKVQAAAMLDTIAYYRRSNKHLGFFTADLVDKVLPIYKEIFRFDGSVKSHANADGSIHWVQMNFKDGATWCVSIGEGKDLTTGGDSTLGMGMDETGLPGGTVELAGLGKAIKSKEAKHRFGDYVVGACK